MSRLSVRHDGALWDVRVSRREPKSSLQSVWLYRVNQRTKEEYKFLLCQVQNNGRFGWSVMVAGGGELPGLRLVEGFKARWQAIGYAVKIRTVPVVVTT